MNGCFIINFVIYCYINLALWFFKLAASIFCDYYDSLFPLFDVDKGGEERTEDAKGQPCTNSGGVFYQCSVITHLARICHHQKGGVCEQPFTLDSFVW